MLLADEINRTPPKTQAALLEAMQERTVTFAGQTYPLPQPFFVLATQNPIEQAGTYPLPEAQLDRFLLHIDVGYPTEDEEIAMVSATTHAGLRDADAGDGRGQPAAPAAAGARHRDRRAPAALRHAPGARHPARRTRRRRRDQARGLGRRSARRPGAGAGLQGARADARAPGRHARGYRAPCCCRCWRTACCAISRPRPTALRLPTSCVRCATEITVDKD